MFEAELEKQKFEFEKELKLLEYKLKEQELHHKYHQTAVTDATERFKLGDTPERKDAFKQSIDALLEAIRFRRSKPPGGGSVQ